MPVITRLLCPQPPPRMSRAVLVSLSLSNRASPVQPRNGFTITPRYCPLRHLSQRNEHLCSCRNSYTNDCECVCVCVCVCVKSLQSCLPLCDPMDCNPPGSSIHGIVQARILEWVRACLQGIFTGIKSMPLVTLSLADKFFTSSTTWEAQ